LLRKPVSKNRGQSIMEVLIVMMIGTWAIALVVGLCKPMLTAQDSEQASMEQIQVMSSTLYRLERDVRQSDPNGIFMCANVAGVITCNQASNYFQPTDVSCLAVLTAQVNGTGPTRWDSTGRPDWKGFNVYWLVPDALGTNTMFFAFSSAGVVHGLGATVLNEDAASAAADAIANTGALPVAHDILHFQSMVDVNKDRVALRLVGRTTARGASNQMTVEGDAYARN
jgi:hypothetical protein